MKILHGLLISIFLLFSAAASAVNIQGIKVFSDLNQPLVAEIPIGGVDAYFLQNLQVQVASRDKFEAAGIPQLAIFNQFRFAKVTNARAMPIIRVTTEQLVSEPILTFLLTFTYPAGTITREFNVMLDLQTQSIVREPRHFAYNSLIAAERASKKVQQAADKADAAARPIIALADEPAAPLKLAAAAPELPTVIADAATLQEGLLAEPLYEAPSEIFRVMTQVMPAWLSVDANAAKAMPSSETLILLPPQNVTSPTVKLMATGNIKPKAMLLPPALSFPQPKTSVNYLYLGLFLVGLLVALSWRYRDRLQALLAKKAIKEKITPSVAEAQIAKASRLAEIITQQKIIKTINENELDPLEEATVYIKYQRYEQAELVLKNAIELAPSRFELYEKLLDIYAKTANPQAFDAVLGSIPADLISTEKLAAKITAIRNRYDTTTENAVPITSEVNNAIEVSNQSLSTPVQSTIDQKEYIAGKMTMALACIDMQDYANALELLEEVGQAGSPEQQQEVAVLIKKITSSQGDDSGNNIIDFK